MFSKHVRQIWGPRNDHSTDIGDRMSTPTASPTKRFAKLLATPWAAGLFFIALVLLSIQLRTSAIGASFWMDEGLSVGIASHDLFDIPSVMRHDGSPPLYYMLLSVWMGLFGRTEEATHTLSLVSSLLTIPAGLWIGWSLFGRRAGLMAAALFAFSAFLTYYAQETRMYSLMAMLALLATGCFIKGFVLGRRRWLVGFALFEALMLYTHGWGIFFGIASALALIPVLLASDDRRQILIDAALTFGAIAVIFLPWLPTLIYQAAHTGAPWANPPRFGVVKQISQGIMGGDRVTIALLFAGVIGVVAIFAPTRSIRVGGELKDAEGGPLSGQRLRTAMLVLVVLAIGSLIVAWLESQFKPAWVIRYMAVVVGPMLLFAAVAASRSGWVGIVGIAAACLLATGSSLDGELLNKSNARNIATELRGDLHPGDLVVVGQPEQTPLNWYYLPGGLRFADLTGPNPDPRMLNWVDVTDKLRAAAPLPTYEKLIAKLPVGAGVVFIRPITVGLTNWSAPWTNLIRLRSAQWGGLFESDPRLVKVKAAPWFYIPASTVANNAVLYRKIGSRR